MDGKHKRFENPERVRELNPEGTLKRIGMGKNSVFCDIGAGTGVFTVPAALLTKNTVYALELNEELIAVIREKASRSRLPNIEAIKVGSEPSGPRDHSVDIALMATVLHEISDQSGFLENVRRMLKEDGRAAVIEFHKRKTPMGPPTAHRMGREEVIKAMRKSGFQLFDDFDLGENFYCLVFQ